MNVIESIAAARQSGVPLVAIRTIDPAATIRNIVDKVSPKAPKICWEMIQGYKPANDLPTSSAATGLTKDCANSPLEALKAARSTPENTMVFVQMADRFLNMPPVIQAIWNLRDQFKSTGRMLIMLGADMELPAELRHDVLTLDEPLPSEEELRSIVQELAKAAELDVNDELIGETVNAVSGLSSFEAEQVTAMSIDFDKRSIRIEECWERKRKMIEQTKGLTVFRGKDRFDDLAGLDQVKRYVTGMMNGPRKPKAIVWLDELEKSGLAHTGDLSGVNSDQLGTVLSYMEDRKVFGLMLVGVPGCQPKGSMVLMADGTWKQVQDVQVGDLVVSPQHDGTCVHAEVMATAKYSDKPIYEVSDERGRRYFCSGDHVVPHVGIRTESLVEAGVHGRNHDTRKTLHELKEMTAEEIAAYPKTRKNRVRIFSTSAVEFDAIDPAINPYLLGVLIGDGCLSHKGCRITNPDKEIKASLEADGIQFGKEYTGNGHCPTYGLVGESRVKTEEYLKSQGLNCKSIGKFIPADCLRASMHFRLELLAGLIDTDGEARSFSSASCQLASNFVYLVKSIGGTATIKHRITRCNGKEFPSWRVEFSFAEKRPHIRVQRKRQSPRDMKWKNPRNCHGTVKLTDRVEDVYGFTLDSESSWYVTDNMLVTHNSGKSHLCKSMSAEFGRIVIRMDMGAMQGSLVGESQQNLRKALKTVDAIGGSNTLFVATSNSIDGLDVALKSRFTGTFFFDLPTKEQLAQAWEIHKKLEGVDGEPPDDTGWSGRNVQRCCQEAASQRISLVEAANYIIPELVSNREAIEHMRKAAEGKYLSSCYPGPYQQAAKIVNVSKKRAFG